MSNNKSKKTVNNPPKGYNERVAVINLYRMIGSTNAYMLIYTAQNRKPISATVPEHLKVVKSDLIVSVHSLTLSKR